MLNKFKIKVKRNFKVLDVGGASGVFAYLFKNDLKLKTIDVIDLSLQGNFIKKYNINYINSDIENFNTRKKYNFITANFVLEHFKKPTVIINKLKSELSLLAGSYLSREDAKIVIDRFNNSLNKLRISVGATSIKWTEIEL